MVKPELAAVLNALFGWSTRPRRTARTSSRRCCRASRAQPDPRRKTGKPVDTLKLNLGVPAAAARTASACSAATSPGYPNGRRLTDDVVDIELQVVAGVLKGNKVPLGDGVDQNDVPFLTTFPYVAPPNPSANPVLDRRAAQGERQGHGTSTPPSFSVPVVSGAAGHNGGGPDASVWVLFGAGALALAGLGRRVARGGKGKGVATTGAERPERGPPRGGPLRAHARRGTDP